MIYNKKRIISIFVMMMLLITTVFITYVDTTKAEPFDTVTFTGFCDDGYIYKTHPTSYLAAWGSIYGSGKDDNWVYFSVGQGYEGGPSPHYHIERGFVFFDTSSIPTGSTISSVKLKLYTYAKFADVSFDVKVQTGSSGHPQMPLVLSDYYQQYYSGNTVGTKSVNSFNTGSYTTIDLSTSSLAVGGTTKLCIRSSRDLIKNVPIGGVEELICFHQNYNTNSNPPKLEVSYTPPNQPPNIPQQPSGPSTGVTGTQYTFNTYTTDPDGDQIYYKWDWDDGTTSDWIGPVNSGELTFGQHTWYNMGTYFVKVKAKDTYGAESDDWSVSHSIIISAGGNQPPYTPSNPIPSHGATGVDINADLYWTGGDPDGDPVTYNVYFGTSSSPPLVSSGQSGTTYYPPTMSYSTTYYWKIKAFDPYVSTTGPVWHFTTESIPTQPHIELTPSNHDFGDITINQCSPEKLFTLTNTGTGTATGTVLLEGVHPDQFEITSGDGTFTLSASQSKPIKVRFCPKSIGGKSAILKADGTNCNDDSSTLTGYGKFDGPYLELTPSSKDFGDIAINECSNPTIFSLKNIGSDTANVEVSLSGADQDEFEITTGGGTYPISPGGHQNIYVKFCPTSKGEKTAKLEAVGTNCNSASSDLSGKGVLESIFSFVHITDLHLHASENDIAGWLKLVEGIKKLNPVPSFVLCTGDIADLGCSNSGKLTYKSFISSGLSGSKGNWMLKGTSIPIYFCPGNHDAYTVAYGINGDFSNYEDLISDLYYTKNFDIKGHSIKLFSLNGGMDSGEFGDTMPNGDGLYESDINSFESDVQGSADIKIVLVHQPYVRFGGGLKGTFDNYRGRFINACDNYGVDLVFSGHTHSGVNAPMDQSGTGLWGNTGKFTIKPNDPTAFIITDSVAGYKDENEQAYYRQIDVYANGDIVINSQEGIKARARNTPFINFLDSHPRMFPMLRLLLQLPIFENLLKSR